MRQVGCARVHPGTPPLFAGRHRADCRLPSEGASPPRRSIPHDVDRYADGRACRLPGLRPCLDPHRARAGPVTSRLSQLARGCRPRSRERTGSASCGCAVLCLPVCAVMWTHLLLLGPACLFVPGRALCAGRPGTLVWWQADSDRVSPSHGPSLVRTVPGQGIRRRCALHTATPILLLGSWDCS
jgi:hypothetical protein